MSIEIKEVKSLADRKAFVDVQFSIYKGSKFWVPPLIKSEIKSIDPEFNPAFEFCDSKFWLAYKNGNCVGRIGALINHPYNEKMSEKIGRFTRLEFFKDKETVEALINTAENWVKEKGMNGIRGPLGFSNLDSQGLLVEGFDHLPSIASVYHHPYYYPYLEDMGFEKENDWIEFRLFHENAIPEKVLKINEIVKQRYSLQIRHFKSYSEIQLYTQRIFKIFNEAFDELPYMHALNEKMIEFYSSKYFKMINPDFVKVIEDKEQNIVGFIISVPSLSEAMQKAKGKLFPIGFLYLKKAMKSPKVIDFFLTGITPGQHGQGAAALLMTELHKEVIKYGVEAVETTGMFESNVKAIQNWKNYPHMQHKRKRCYIKIF